jgi:exodeoxyribonuclease V alpha subunit
LKQFTVGSVVSGGPYLLYTGITRGKRLVVLVGQKKAVAIAVRNISGRRRWSKLQEWLRPKAPSGRSAW